MKKRFGFVSNSSSSSFVCDICEHIESGMDSSASDFEMVTCEHGHTIHKECLTFDPYSDDSPFIRSLLERELKERKESYKRQEDWIAKNSDDYRISNEKSRLEKMSKTISEIEKMLDKDNTDFTDWSDFIEDKTQILKEESCPICNLTFIPTKDAMDWYFTKNSIDIEMVKTEMREERKSSKQ